MGSYKYLIKSLVGFKWNTFMENYIKNRGYYKHPPDTLLILSHWGERNTRCGSGREFTVNKKIKTDWLLSLFLLILFPPLEIIINKVVSLQLFHNRLNFNRFFKVALVYRWPVSVKLP